jgi:hypothetical protein
MKKLALLAMAFLFTAGLVLGQAQTKQAAKTEKKEVKKEVKSERVALRKLEGNTVSELAKSNFNVDFPNASGAQWKRVDTFDEVQFTLNGVSMKGFYDGTGTLVGTTQSKTFADVPAKGQKEIKEKYSGYKIGPVTFFDDNEANETDMIMWGLQFDDEDLYFVELTKGASTLVVKVDSYGAVSFFKKLS